MSASTIVTILSAVLAFISALTGAQLDALWPGHGPQLSIYLSIAVLAIGQVVNAISKQTKGAPQTGVQVGPLAKDLPVVDSTGTPVATNISSSSSVFQPKETTP